MSTQQRLHAFSDALTHIATPGSKTVEELLHSLSKQEVEDFNEILDDDLSEIFSLIITDNGSIIPNAAKNLKGDNTPVVRDKENDTVAVIVEGINIFIKEGDYHMSSSDVPVNFSFFNKLISWFKNL